MTINILIITLLVGLFLIALRFAHKLYPTEPLRAGSKVNVYLDGRHNRTATISHNRHDAICIYDKIMLPISYRNRFYAIGYMGDGHRLMFIGRKRLYFLAHIAELIRKIAGTPEYQDPTIEMDVNAMTDEPKEEEVQDGE